MDTSIFVQWTGMVSICLQNPKQFLALILKINYTFAMIVTVANNSALQQ